MLAVAVAALLTATAVRELGFWSPEPADPSATRPLGKPVAVSGRTVSVLGAGDILLHPEIWDQARRDGGGRFDFRPLFAGARAAISEADLALCHLETPIAPAGGPYQDFPRFSVPEEIVPAIKDTGFDGCSTASNHSIDQGEDGVRRTLDALDRGKVGHSGTYRSAKEAARPTIYSAAGVRVAHLSYTKGFNGISRPPGKEWIANLVDVKKVQRDAEQARRAGAQIVVVSVHWGTEYAHEPDVDQQLWARGIAAIDDVDVVFGHHAHVVQPIERVSGKWVVYGMGNQVARHEEPVNENREGAMVRVTFSPADRSGRWKVAAVEALPVFVDLNPDIRLVDLERALADPATPFARRRIYEAAVERVASHLLTRGADSAGLVVRGTTR